MLCATFLLTTLWCFPVYYCMIFTLILTYLLPLFPHFSHLHSFNNSALCLLLITLLGFSAFFTAFCTPPHFVSYFQHSFRPFRMPLYLVVLILVIYYITGHTSVEIKISLTKMENIYYACNTLGLNLAKDPWTRGHKGISPPGGGGAARLHGGKILPLGLA